MVHDFEHGPFPLLKISNNLKEIFCLRIARRTKHPHQHFRRFSQVRTELDEADSAIDVLAEYGLSGLYVSCKQAGKTFAEVSAAESG